MTSPLDKSPFRGRSALVTGSSRGIGAAVALLLDEQGHRLINRPAVHRSVGARL
jgi:NAD(P)-dependent dehydrogenase (short-subunit alcohol dehydrogenase family)